MITKNRSALVHLKLGLYSMHKRFYRSSTATSTSSRRDLSSTPPMEHRCEEDNYFEGSKFHQDEHYCFLDFSFEYLLEEALFFSTQHQCASTATQSISLQDELDTLFEGDILSFWDAMEEEAHHKSEEEPKLCRDAAEKATKMQRRRSSGSEEKPLLTFEMLSRHFCVPIKKAAQELKVGLTHLKKRCRELGIPRWPHRKVKSLQTLIKNVQELGRDTGEEGGRTKIVVEMLQQTKKLIVERPGEFVLDQETIVLRQACFKEQFKRRRLMASNG